MTKKFEERMTSAVKHLETEYASFKSLNLFTIISFSKTVSPDKCIISNLSFKAVGILDTSFAVKIKNTCDKSNSSSI